jgi:hypothetical protein
VKNVESVTVNLFEINTTTVYKRTAAEVSTGINLDGLLPMSSCTIDRQGVSALAVTQHVLQLPELQVARRGVFVVDVVGGGLSSRAVIRKGALRVLERLSPAGHAFVVLDESNNQVATSQVELWIDNSLFTGEKEIFVPFSTSPRRKTGVITLRGSAVEGLDSESKDGDALGFSSLFQFDHLRESYCLDTAIVVCDESLLRGNQRAKVLLSGTLTATSRNIEVPLSLLKEAALTVTITDNEGTESKQVFKDFTLSEAEETELTFALPLLPRPCGSTSRQGCSQ